MRLILALLLLSLLLAMQLDAQDTLPRFSAVIKANGKVLISWRNKYPKVSQISIQRSSDSLRNFTTLLTLPDPTIPENGFVDNKSSGANMYYRLFILLENSRYLFTKSKKAVAESAPPVVVAKSPPPEKKHLETPPPPPPEDSSDAHLNNQRMFYAPNYVAAENPKVSSPSQISGQPRLDLEKIIFIKEKDSLLKPLPGRLIREFRDSILNKTKDTILFVHADTILIKAFVAKPVKEVFKVSPYVYTTKEGNVTIALPDASRKKYSLKFFEEDSSPTLEVKEIKESPLILDKANFLHSGWFRFELYEDGKLKEKNLIYIPREF